MPGESTQAGVRPDDVTFEHRSARFRFGNLTYTLRGFSPTVISFLRVPVRAECGNQVHLDRVDLSAVRARTKYAEGAARKLGVDAKEVDTHLLSILATLDEHSRKELEDRDRPFVAKPPPLTEADREKAHRFLKSTTLLDAIEEDLSGLGYVGEGANKKLVYLIGISRKLPAPLAGILRSSSGSGKSALLELITRVAPPEDVVFLSELTPQALYYLDRTALKHKLLVVDERAGSERADYAIRTLLSRQTLTLALTAPDTVTGQRSTRLVEVEGPVAYLESTTAPILNPENTSRALEVFLDESPEQTRAIQEAQRERRVHMAVDPGKELLEFHRNIQRCLKPSTVQIPYAGLLSFPAELPRHRRDHEKFLRLIEASTLLHQHQREAIDDILVATLDDYRIAYELARPVLARAGDGITPWAREALAHLRDKEVLEFTRRDLVRGLGWSPIRVWRVLQELSRADFVVLLPNHPERRRRYRVLEFYQEGTNLTRLLPPDDLARRFGSAGFHEDSV